MKSILRLSFLLLFTGIHPFGCSPCGKSGGPRMVTIESYSMRFTGMYYDGHSYTEGGRYPADTTAYYHADSVAIELGPDEVKRVALKENVPALFGSPSLWACDPLPPKVLNGIQTLDIIAQGSFAINGKQITTGDTINEYFGHILYFNKEETEPLSTVATTYREPEYDYHRIFIKPAFENRDTVRLHFGVFINLTDGKGIQLKDGYLKLSAK